MKRRIRAFAVVLGLSATALAPAAASAHAVTPVPKLEVSKYLGTWRQIAAKPQWFEAACLSDVYANYTLNADGSVRVKNTCAGPYGSKVTTIGRARVLDPVTSAQLQVSFLNFGTGWVYPDRTPNYIVFGLGDAYDWAVVGDPARSSAFILSRTATLTADQRAKVVAALTENGYDPCRLKVTPQQGGATKAVSLCVAT
jgi:apolipoprotein D and lipocalin family protein